MNRSQFSLGVLSFALLSAVPAEARMTLGDSERSQRITGRELADRSRLFANELDLSAARRILAAAKAKTKEEADALRTEAALERQQAAELRHSAHTVDSSPFKNVMIPLLAGGAIAGAAVGIAAASGSSSTPPSTYMPPPYTPPQAISSSPPMVMPYFPPPAAASSTTSGSERHDRARADLRDSTVASQVEVVPPELLRRRGVAP